MRGSPAICIRTTPAPDSAAASTTAQAFASSEQCAECHRRETGAIVHQFERSQHAAGGVSCLDCHQPQAGQHSEEHHGFTLTTQMTSLNCKVCHASEYDQFPEISEVAGS